MFTKGLKDLWWLSIDGVQEEQILRLDEIRERVQLGDYEDVRVLPVSEASKEKPQWLEWTMVKPGEPRREKTLPREMVLDTRPAQRREPDVQAESTVGLLLVLVPMMGAVLVGSVGFHVKGLVLAHNFAVVMLAAVVVGTAFLAALEANRLPMKAFGRTGPIGWFLGVSLLWLICYPAFLFCRGRAGAPTHVLGGSIGMLSFLGITAWLFYAIEQEHAKIEKELGDLRGEIVPAWRALNR